MDQSESELKKSFDKIANSYDDNTNTFHHKISEYLTSSNLMIEIPKDKNTRILDSGGGTGKYAIFLAKQGYDITLSDISNKKVKLAQEKAQDEGVKIKTVVCNSENTEFPENSFDMLMMNGGVISYTPHPDKLLSECNRILRANGILWFDFLNTIGWAIETTNEEQKVNISEEKEKLIRMPDWDYPARLFSVKRIEDLLKQSGFQIRSKYGLVLLSNSMTLERRYSREYNGELLERFKKIELRLSRNKDCFGASWSCSICAIKNDKNTIKAD